MHLRVSLPWHHTPDSCLCSHLQPCLPHAAGSILGLPKPGKKKITNSVNRTQNAVLILAPGYFFSRSETTHKSLTHALFPAPKDMSVAVNACFIVKF